MLQLAQRTIKAVSRALWNLSQSSPHEATAAATVPATEIATAQRRSAPNSFIASDAPFAGSSPASALQSGHASGALSPSAESSLWQRAH